MFEQFDQRAVYKVQLPQGQRRLKEAILYVSDKCRDLAFFGLTKLNKTLWRADFRSFYERRQPVTGRQYQRLVNGPAPVEMPPLLRELAREGHLAFEHRKMGNVVETRPIAKAAAVLNFFSAEDIDYLDESIKHYWDMTGTETSDQSHGIAWKTRKDGDPIPYQAAYFEDTPLEPSNLNRLASLGEKQHWRSQ